jgi:hypothetical protein
MTFKIGEEVSLNNKTYKIVGTVKRSWLLERDGKQYKATSNMMNKIKEQNAKGIGMGKRGHKKNKVSDLVHLKRRVEFRKIFDKNAKMPETEKELMDVLSILCAELSPENLSCDGELSMSAMKKKASAIKAEWKEVEYLLGRKVSEGEAEDHWMAEYRKRSCA